MAAKNYAVAADKFKYCIAHLDVNEEYSLKYPNLNLAICYEKLEKYEEAEKFLL